MGGGGAGGEADEGVIDAGGVGLGDILVPHEERVLTSGCAEVRQGAEVEVLHPRLVLSVSSGGSLVPLVIVFRFEAGIKVSGEDHWARVMRQESSRLVMEEVSSLLVPRWVVDSNNEGGMVWGWSWDLKGKDVSV